MKIVSEFPHFSIVPEWLIESKISDNALRVYATLCRYADKHDGTCYPSIQTIGKRCHKSTSTVKRAIKELQDYNAIDVQPRFLDNQAGQTSNLYIIKFNPAFTKYDTQPHIKNDIGGSSNMTHKQKSINQSHIISDKTNKGEIYLALCENLWQPKTKNEISSFNKVAKDLSEVNATAEQVKDRVFIYKKKWPTMTLTPFALSKNWTLLGEMYETNKPVKVRNCITDGHEYLDSGFINDEYILLICRFCLDEKKEILE